VLDCNETLFYKIVKSGFGQRRKTLRNSLKEYITPDISNKDIFSKRPEQLSVNDFILLSNIIDDNQSK